MLPKPVLRSLQGLRHGAKLFICILAIAELLAFGPAEAWKQASRSSR
jgi:hypothetical protein